MGLVRVNYVRGVCEYVCPGTFKRRGCIYINESSFTHTGHYLYHRNNIYMFALRKNTRKSGNWKIKTIGGYLESRLFENQITINSTVELNIVLPNDLLSGNKN